MSALACTRPQLTPDPVFTNLRVLRVAPTSPRSVIVQNDLDQPLSGQENINSTLVMPFPVELLRFFSRTEHSSAHSMLPLRLNYNVH